MTGHSSYRVYEADYSQSIPAITLRRGEVSPKDGGFFGFGVLVVIVVVFISGSAFAGQKLYDTQLAKSPRLAQARANEASSAAGAAGAVGGGALPSFAMSLSVTAAPIAASSTPSASARQAPEAAQVAQAQVQVPAAVAAPVRPARVATADATRLRRNVQQPRRVASVSSGDINALPEGRGAVHGSAEPPPNPF